MNCSFESNDCSKAPALETEAEETCVELSSAVDADMWDLEETWYVKYGYNPGYDCFACQKMTIVYDWNRYASEPVTIDTVYDIKAVNGTNIWNDNKLFGLYEDGVFTMNGRDNGLSNMVQMNVLLAEPDILIIYYCGEILH